MQSYIGPAFSNLEKIDLKTETLKYNVSREKCGKIGKLLFGIKQNPTIVSSLLGELAAKVHNFFEFLLHAGKIGS